MTINTIKSITVDPFNQFIKKESSSSIIMLGAMIAAMILANSGLSGWYEDLWHKKVGFTFGDFSLYKSLHHWINDGLMALFFLVIGLEIKREILIGELSSFRNALLPIIAAVGGAVVPALIYVGLNFKNGDLSGWGVPMATDIAFAIGVMALLGNRVPIQLKIFITSLAVVDDMIAVIVIALFYTENIVMGYLVYAGIVMAVLLAMNLFKIRSILAYLIMGMFLWYFFLKSGIHATIAGVLLALFIPSEPRLPMQAFKRSMNMFLGQLKNCDNNVDSEIPTKCQKSVLNKMIHTSLSTYNPMSRLEYNLHGLSAFIIMPIFAFANTGVKINPSDIMLILSPVSLGIILGLVVGKPIGITGFVHLGKKMNLISLPAEINMAQVFGAAVLSGIGLTMSIFIASMAFAPEMVGTAKIAILTASVIAGVSGFVLLKSLSSKGKVQEETTTDEQVSAG